MQLFLTQTHPFPPGGRYTRVFQYLVRLKRVQLELERAWATAMQSDKRDAAAQLRAPPRLPPRAQQAAADRQRARRSMWRVRQHMSYLATNLQFYIQVGAPFLLIRTISIRS
jgi:gamma-tubulin complex component 4